MRKPVRACVLGWLLAAATVVFTAASAQTPRLGIVSPFVVLGTNATLTVTHQPSASYILYLAIQPAETPLGSTGTLFLKSGTFVPVATGTLNASGTATVQLPITSPPALNGTVYYLQALVTSAGVPRLSNSVALRAQARTPSGGRSPRAIAVTPDGRKAYVAHQLDGTVSVVDLAAARKAADLPVGPTAARIAFRPVDIAIDPEGRHAFVVNVASAAITVIDVATDSIAGQIPALKGSRRIAFDFTAGNRRIYVTNEIANAILVFAETVPGTFASLARIPLQGAVPGPIVRLSDGRLAVGHRATLELEIINPAAAAGATTLARIALGSQPLDLAATGSDVFVGSFAAAAMASLNGTNVVRRLNVDTLQFGAALFPNAGTDYGALAIGGSLIGVAGTASGSVVIGDLNSGTLLDTVNLLGTTAEPNATPQAIAFGPPTGAPGVLYTVDQFRETVQSINLGGVPPYAVGSEIPLAYSGAARIPLSGDLSAFEDGDYLMRSVHFFNGTAQTPNSVSCQTCHNDGYSDHITRSTGRKPNSLNNLAATAPYGWQGTAFDLLAIIRGAFNTHGKIGGQIAGNTDITLQQFLLAFTPPTSIYLGSGGALSADAQTGKTLFEGVAGCTSCHAAPAFVPPPGQPRTIAAGVGTGLAPINVPGLRGVWMNGPYFHDGSAKRLGDVFTAKPGDVHNVLTLGLTADQKRQLVAYLQSL